LPTLTSPVRVNCKIKPQVRKGPHERGRNFHPKIRWSEQPDETFASTRGIADRSEKLSVRSQLTLLGGETLISAFHF
jgi:hypothetical protein